MLSRTACHNGSRQLSVFAASAARVRLQSTTPNYEHLQTELPARPKVVLYDDITPLNTHRLNISLASFVPESWVPQGIQPPEPDSSKFLPPAHHLLYFNSAYPEKQLLSDGTDPNQSPGPPFIRRMWAGGYVRWNPERAISVDSSRYACVEGIRDVAIKGKPGEQKVFVGIERRFGPVEKGETEDSVRERLWEESEDDFGVSRLIERRNIAFMHERTPEELARVKAEGAAPSPAKLLRRKLPIPHIARCIVRRMLVLGSLTVNIAQNAPTFSHTLVPTPALLFRYSALTFNAHAIHLDPLYCREVEGHRNLLFHGPLSFTLLVALLQNHISKSNGASIASIEYRNLAPLYCSEPVKLCGREASNGKYEVWAETPEGGIAVKGTARVVGE